MINQNIIIDQIYLKIKIFYKKITKTLRVAVSIICMPSIINNVLYMVDGNKKIHLQ